MHLLSDLFVTFAKIGMFTFGGGYAMIALIENACVQEKKWITEEEMMTMTVIVESTPGPIAINCATYVGYRQKGMAGAVAATLGMVMPSFLIICLIAMYLDQFLAIRWIADAFRGIKTAVGLLIIDAAVKMIVRMPKKPLPLGITTAAALILLAGNLLAVHISSIVLMLAAGMLSLLVFAAAQRAGREGI